MGIATYFTAGDLYETATPTDGQTVVLRDDNRTGTMYLNPIGTLNTLTVQLPSDAKSRLGQIRFISTSKAINSLTLTGATVYNIPSALALGDSFAIIKTAASTWAKL